jgi:hypothetical protein
MTYASQPGKHARAGPVCKALIARSLRDSFQCDDLPEESSNLADAQKRAAVAGGSSDNREASNRVDRSHSVSTEWTITVMMEKA